MSSTTAPWSPEVIALAVETLQRHRQANLAAAELSQRLGRYVTVNQLKHALRSRGLGTPSDYTMGGPRNRLEDLRQAVTPPAPPGADYRPADEADVLGDQPSATYEGLTPQQSELVSKLVRRAQRAPVQFSQLCDDLDMAPSKVKDLLDLAQRAGVEVSITHDHVSIEEPAPNDRVVDANIPPVTGAPQRVAVITDTHFGSKYCLRKQLREFIWYAYSVGVREVLHVGDFLDGMYRHGLNELSHYGFDDQCADAYRTLPELPELRYFCIAGNHDATFWERTGQNPGGAIESWFRHPSLQYREPDDPNQAPLLGRQDVSFLGHRGAFLNIRGAIVHLWHPKSGKSYAKSYHMQKLVHMYASSEKPNISLAGHWHIFNYCVERGVHLVACPTFQGGGSAYGKSLGGAPELGGLILEWETTEHGTMRTFKLERRSYFEVEKRHRIDVVDQNQVYQGFAD